VDGELVQMTINPQGGLIEVKIREEDGRDVHYRAEVVVPSGETWDRSRVESELAKALSTRVESVRKDAETSTPVSPTPQMIHIGEGISFYAQPAPAAPDAADVPRLGAWAPDATLEAAEPNEAVSEPDESPEEIPTEVARRTGD
jgi:hypothetical protein